MNNKQYYVTLPDKAQEGPYDEKDLIIRYQAGKYPKGTLIWCDGMESWKSIADVFKPIDVQSLPSLISPSRQQSCSHNLPLAVWIIGSAILGGGVGFSIASLLHQPSEKIIYLENPILRRADKQEVESKLLHRPSEKIVYLEKPISRETVKQEAESKQNIEQDRNVSTNDSEWDKSISAVEEVTQTYTNERMIQRSKRLLFLLNKIRDGKADINTKHPEYDESALNLAVRLNMVDVVSVLLKNGADTMHISRDDRRNPLACACSEQNINIVKMLLENGADPNSFVDRYCGPLYYAVNKDNPGIVRLLLQHGANPDLYRDGVHTLYSMAKSNEVRNLIKTYINSN